MYGCQTKVAALNFGLISGPARDIGTLSFSNALKPSEGSRDGAFMILIVHGELAHVLPRNLTAAPGVIAERRFWGLKKENKKWQPLLLN